MRIVSQNRTFSVDFDKVIVKLASDDAITCESYSGTGRTIVLGKYASGRASEVFEDIHKAYWPADVLEIPTDVYYMPEE